MYKAIVSVKYIGPTNNRGSRYRLKMAGTKAKFISYDTFTDDPRTAISDYIEANRCGDSYYSHLVDMQAVSNPEDKGPDLFIATYCHKPRSAA